MEGLRGFAVLLVFFVHYISLLDPWMERASALDDFTRLLHILGNTGVDLFFVLSGYLIYGSLIARPQPFLKFMSRRVERIYPTFLVVLAVYIGLSFAMPSESKIPGGGLEATIFIVENILLLPGLNSTVPIITVAWSLSYEMFYYLVLPLVIGLFALRRRTVGARVALFVAIPAAMWVWCALGGSHVRLSMFAAGILLHEVMTHKLVRAPAGWVGAVVLIAGFFYMLLPIPNQAAFAFRTAVLFFTFGVLCFACFSNPESSFTKLFTWTPLRWLGNMSYSYYLLHGLALKASVMVLAKVIPPEPKPAYFFFAMLPPMLAVTLVASGALFILIERPLSLAPRRPKVEGAAQRA